MADTFIAKFDEFARIYLGESNSKENMLIWHGKNDDVILEKKANSKNAHFHLIKWP